MPEKEFRGKCLSAFGECLLRRFSRTEEQEIGDVLSCLTKQKIEIDWCIEKLTELLEKLKTEKEIREK